MGATKIAIAILLLSTLSLFTSSESQASNKGRWKLLKQSLGISAMHMALLPNGKIVAFDRTDAGPSNISLPLGKCLNRSNNYDCTAHSVEFDPSYRGVRPLTVLTETWCSSGALSANGNLVQTGGYNAGDHAVRYFSPCENCDWIENEHGLAVRRWYATNHILPDRRVIVVGGRAQFNYEFVPKFSSSDYSVFQLPFLRETKDQWENNLYPFVHLSTDGNLFIFANTRAILLDYLNHKVIRNYPEMPGGISRNYPSSGSSVLLPLRLNHNDTVVKAVVMICGGTKTTSYSKAVNGTFLPASSSCGQLVITDESPKWKMEEMPIGRVMGDMILLPTGDVLIINGAAKGTAGWGLARDPVLNPVIYRTGVTSNESHTFKVLNPSSIPRLYHSTAHLISDGRVLVGGSNTNTRYEFTGVLFPTELSLEAFFPPYLGSEGLGVDRPKITSIEPGVDIGYGERLRIGFVVKGISRDAMREGVYVTMVAPSFTTHSFSMNQRSLVLEVESLRHIRGGRIRGGRRYAVDGFAPANGALAPAGYYLMFVVHGGVPSRGKWVHIRQ